MLLVFLLFNTVMADVVTNIWQSLQIMSTPELFKPQDIRTAVLGWKINVDEVKPYDVFTLTMPYVFRTKFEGSTLQLQVDGVTYASCVAHDGSYILDFSSLDCTITNAVDTDRNLSLSGTISFDFTFGAGGSSHDVDITEAAAFHEGVNEIVWGGYLITSVDFTPGTFFPDQDDSGNLFYSRTTPQNMEQLISISGSCVGGIRAGSLAIGANSRVDCSRLKLFMTSELNAFMLPLNTASLEHGSIECSDDGSMITASFENIPEGYRVAVEGLVPYPPTGDIIDHPYGEYLECNDGTVLESYNRRYISIVDGFSSGTGRLNEVVIVTSTWTGTYTRQTTLPAPSGASTITIEVDVPNTELTTTTTTRPWDNTYTSTTTLPHDGGSVITVVVETPLEESSLVGSSELDVSSEISVCTDCEDSTEASTSEVESSSSSAESSDFSAEESNSIESLEVYTSVVSTFSASSEFSFSSDLSSSTELSSDSITPSVLPVASSVLSSTSSEDKVTSTTTTVTESWSNSFTSTSTRPYSTNDRTITVVVCVPTPNQSIEKTETTTFTSTWNLPYTTTTTLPYTSGDKTVSVCLQVPFGYFNTSPSSESHLCVGCIEFTTSSSESHSCVSCIELSTSKNTLVPTKSILTPIVAYTTKTAVVTSTHETTKSSNFETTGPKLHTDIPSKVEHSNHPDNPTTDQPAHQASTIGRTVTTHAINSKSQELSSTVASTTSFFSFKLIESESPSPISHRLTHSGTTGSGDAHALSETSVTRPVTVSTQSNNKASTEAFNWYLFMLLVPWLF